MRDAWKRKLALLGLDLHLLSPLVVERIWFRGNEPLRFFLFSLAASLASLALLHGAFRRPAIRHLVLLPFHLVATADLFALAVYRTRISSSVLSLILENTSSTRDFVVAHASPIFAALAATVALYALCIYVLRGVDGPRRPWLSAVAGVALGVLYGGGLVVRGDFARLVVMDRSAPFSVVPQAWLAWNIYRELDTEDTRALRFHARRAEVVDAPETYVLVIGESARPDHFGLYGYDRQTTPRLSRQSNLVVFRDVVTQAAYTSASVPLLLTRGSAAEPQRERGERSIASLFGEIGFDTRWLSTQRREPYAVAINRCSGDAREQHFAENQWDGALVGMMERALAHATDGSKRFIVLHTMGSHFPYNERYPPSFAKFAAADTTWRATLVRDYDDSVLYTDTVLSDLIAVLSSTPGVKALLYVADHGENLRDDDRDLVGHYRANEYDLPVPMLLWYSSELAERWPEKIAAARRSSTMRMTTRSVFYTLADLAGATFDDPALETLSVLRPGFREATRVVKRGEGTFDYDAWRTEQHPAHAAR